MSILEPLKAVVRPAPKAPDKVPPDINDRVNRGRKAKGAGAATRKLCQKFFEGDHYWYKDAKGFLRVQTSGMVGVVGVDKTPYRIRNTYNWIGTIIEGKVSASTQLVPGYETTPATDDYEAEAGASLAQKVAVYGYDQWRVRRHTKKAFTRAFVQREGFAMAYFDPNQGSYKQDPATGQWRADGEVRIMDLSREEVMWEDGEDFEDSRWYGIEKERLKSEVRKMPGYIPGTLDPEKGEKGDPGEKVVVTEYLERPCPDYPQGRRCFIADGKVVVDYRRDPACEEYRAESGQEWDNWWEPYPTMDANGSVADEPPMVRISYTVNPDGDDLGLAERIIDLNRTVTDCWNKILEIKNRGLVPQMVAPRGSNVTRRDDTPGATWYYDPVLDNKPEWEKPIDPGYIQQLLGVMREALEQLRALSSDVDVQPAPDVAARTVNAAVQQAQLRWQAFLGDAAEFHSRLMRQCLTLVARYYTEERQIQIRGQYGWEPLNAFTGADLRSQVNVRVLPGSLESKSRQAIQQEIQFIQANWPGAISPEAALATLHGGSAEGLLRSYVNDVAKAWRVVRRLKTGPDAMLSFPSRFDPTIPNPNFDPTLPPGPGNLQMGVDVPGWMPAPTDNIQIWRQVIGDYMKTEDFERLDEPVQHAFWLVWNGLDHAEQMRAAKQAAQQQMQAESLGMSNAARPQLPPPLPDRAGFTPENSSPAEAV